MGKQIDLFAQMFTNQKNKGSLSFGALCPVHHTQFGQSFILGVDLTLSLVFGNNQPTTEQGWSISFNLLFQIFKNQSRETVCASLKFSKDMIGYDLRRNESVSYDYKRLFAPNMYSKVE